MTLRRPALLGHDMIVPQSQKSLSDAAGAQFAPARRNAAPVTIHEPYAPVWTGQPVAAAGPSSQPPFHPAFERLLKRLPEEHRRALTDEQLRALALASIPSPSNHSIEYRVSVPFFGRRYYFTVFAGREQRSLARLVAEGQLPVMQIARMNPVAWTLMLSLVGFGLLMALLIAKAMLGIELTDSVALPDVIPHLTDTDLRPN